MKKIDWDEVYQKQSGELIGVAYRYVRDRERAADIVQDAFVVATQKADRFLGKGTFEAWLRKIVVNECLMSLRNSKLKTEKFEDDLHTPTGEFQIAEVEEDWDYSDDPDKRKIIERCDFSREDLLEIVTQLPERHRLTFNMYVVDGFSHKEIAAQLNITEGASKWYLNTARKKMQDLLYEKALDMRNKKRKKMLIAVWIGALFGKTSVVDAKYLNAFSDFKLPVPPPTVGLEQAIAVAPTATIGLSTTAISIIAGCICVAVGAGTVAVIERQNNRTEEICTAIQYQKDYIENYEHVEPLVYEDYIEESVQIITPIYTPVRTEIVEEKLDVIEECEPVVIITRRITIIEETVYDY